MAKKILVIDDDRLVVKSLSKLLEMQGYEVSIAQSGEEALKIVDKLDFDLIISDIRMPDMDGVEAMRRIGQFLRKAGRKEPSVIFITGYPNDSSTQEAKKLNVDDFIYKPFDKNKFLESVANSIKSS
jgi:CheY-like chemotaxis protein